MRKFSWFIVPVFFLCFSPLDVHVPQSKIDNLTDGAKKGIGFYHRAIKLFELSEPTAYTDSLCLLLFTQVVDQLKPSVETASILLDCYEKSGILKQTYEQYEDARILYKKAIAMGSLYGLSDSLLFKPYLYCGSVDYFLNAIDSSLYHFEKAEQIFIKYPLVEDTERLFNSFGVIYYESGNYHQCINYFRKALDLHKRKQPVDPLTIYSFKSNIGTALRHIGQYDSAILMYKRLIPYKLNIGQLYVNIGSTYLEKKQPDSALYYLTKAVTGKSGFEIKWENAIGTAFLQKKDYAKAYMHLNNALALAGGDDSTISINAGRTYKLLGDLEKERQQYARALQYYHKSILRLNAVFSDTTVSQNPANFTKGFSSFSLFESLAAKATCWQLLYRNNQVPQTLAAAIGSYRSAFKLIDYIGKSFDNENSRLFMVSKAAPLYQEAVEFLIYVYENTGNGDYLQEAFVWAEKSKAASLAAGIKENEIKSFTGVPDSLLKKERNLKFNLSKLMLRLEDQLTRQEEESVQSSLQDVELSLSRLQAAFHEYPAYRQKKFEFDSINVTHVQNRVLTNQTAVLSFFHGSSFVHLFVLRKNGFYHHKTELDSTYLKDIALLKIELADLSPDEQYEGLVPAQRLYNKLILPIKPHLKNCTSLLIILNNQLNGISMEALEDTDGNYFVEKFNITYQYALSFLQGSDNTVKDISWQNMLAVAPFHEETRSNTFQYTPLPYSAEEIAGLPGKKLMGNQATKSNFLKHSSASSHIHLATHAVADGADPSRSHILFYPAKEAENRLYAHELYHTPFEKLDLVFLSACESGSGKMIDSEGIMSLSRAFSYSGCPNLITSLWKAEDHATAYISRKFYSHLGHGYSYAKALQQAKIDLLHDKEYAQFHRPIYWANLVLIGNVPQPAGEGIGIWLYIVVSLALLAALWFTIRARGAFGNLVRQ
jgi:CHAT domain-containing protein/Tfp pilus assembly protein PilF